MSDNVQLLLETSNTVNSKTVSVTRFLLLVLLAYFTDGVQYRELKAALKISDGKLASNLEQLERMTYIRKEEAELDRSKLHIYFLTEKGRRELDKITNWLELVQKVAMKK